MRAMLLGLALLAATPAGAGGSLHIFNWGSYTNPDLIAKFERTYDVAVTVSEFYSNAEALARIEAGGEGFDIVVPTHTHMPQYIARGLLMESRPDLMENFTHVDPRWVHVDWDPGRHYSVPWQWGTTGIAVNTKLYDGDIDTSAVFMDPPEALAGKINVVPEMPDIMAMALMYVGAEPCTTDPETLEKVRAALMAARPRWRSMQPAMTGKLSTNEVLASVNWNGSTFQARLANDELAYGYPRQGYPIWMDSAAILADAPNVENAELFLNFIMAPRNAAMISSFARYANGIVGSEAFMPADMREAREIVVPEALRDAGRFVPLCPDAARAAYAMIWTALQN